MKNLFRSLEIRIAILTLFLSFDHGYGQIAKAVRDPDNWNNLTSEEGLKFGDHVRRIKRDESDSYTETDCGFKCDDGLCIKSQKVCDNYVHCAKGEDERNCTCKDRVTLKKQCDGVPDCPSPNAKEGDEIGCGDCNEDQFSCGSQNEEKVKCIDLAQVCNGAQDCSTGIDEENCFRLENFNHKVRGLLPIGFLQKRIGNTWYTLCKGTKSDYVVARYVKQACTSIVGPMAISDTPKISKRVWPKNADLPTHLINSKFALFGDSESKFKVIQGECPSKTVVTASCPEPQCGWSMGKYSGSNYHTHHHSKKRDTHTQDVEVLFGNEELTGKVVGGSESKLGDWPFLVGIYRNGSFHCGGSIINDKWILSAAHCFHTQQKYVYEVQAGMLRRFSWSPYEQTRQVLEIYSHERYDSLVFRNDIALVRLEVGLSLSKWVSPGCLAPGDGSLDPKPKSECTVIGWGNLAETVHGPDHMQEVNLPTLESCKEFFTKNEEQICAGVVEGGKDACQGDSGGPFVCKDSGGRNIICGVVSFGKGCARKATPGVYTRISYYRKWIESVISGDNYHVKTQSKPKKCTHEKCVKFGGECIFPKFRCNRRVDCYNLEDEWDCEYKDQIQPIDDFDLSHRAYTDVELASHGNAEHTHDFGKAKLCGPTEFQCKMTKSCIPITLICNGHPECSDFSDEMGCDCGTIIQKSFPEKSCNGLPDCIEKDDELQCSYCNSTQLTLCPFSKTCINEEDWCNGRRDCEFGEDELDCIRLSKKANKELSVEFLGDKNLRGLSSGYVHIRLGGMRWRALCAQDEGSRGPFAQANICTYLGFGSQEILNTRKKRENDAENTICAPVKVSCSQPQCGQRKLYAFSQFQPTVSPSKSGEEMNLFGLYPWWMVVLVDGKVLCSGTLVHKDWFLVPKKCILDSGAIRSLSYQYITVMSGYSAQSPIVSSPLEQIRRVNGIELIDTDSNFTLLHLQSSVTSDHFVGPICTSISQEAIHGKDFGKLNCVGVELDSQEHELRSQKVEVRFNRISNKFYLLPAQTIKPTCQDFEDMSVYCDLGINQWYYMGVVVDRIGPGVCTRGILYLENPFFGDMNSKINGVLSRVPFSTYGPPPCNGTRCSLGNCVEEKFVCDKIQQCSDGSDEKRCERHYLGFRSSGHGDDNDEDPNYKHQKNSTMACPTGHFQCSSTGNCLPVDAYCDGIYDCGPHDISDEQDCSCRNYLSIAAPARICDGVIDCPSREDEICNCSSIPADNGKQSMMFTCPSSAQCIPYTLVCDHVNDCAGGAEDELNCITISKSLTSINSAANSTEGYVLTRLKGVWHPYCTTEWSLQLGTQICSYLGYNQAMVLKTFNLYEYSEKKSLELGPKAGTEAKVQVIQLENAQDLDRLHTEHSNIIELDSNEDYEDENIQCQIAYLTCS